MPIFSALIFFEGNIEEAAEYENVKREVLASKNVGASFIQRTFKVGYARASRFLDALEAEGILSAPEPFTAQRKFVIK